MMRGSDFVPLTPVAGNGPSAGGRPGEAGSRRLAAGRGVLAALLATALFGAVHSVLAGTWATERAAGLFGERAVSGLYRPAYVLLSAALTGLLVWYVWRLPGREVYHVRGPLAWAMRAGQAAALAYAGWAVYHVGLDFLVGWDNLVAWLQGAAVIPPPPDGQGPAPAGDGTMRATGPFAHTRHPLNLFIPFFLWLMPRMTTPRLVFALVATVYAVLGSVHDEVHLVRTYGAAYRRYQERVPFFIPGMPAGPVPLLPPAGP
jgi:protein-S-isoprenylcysteine O-methyltransferase Ste14